MDRAAGGDPEAVGVHGAAHQRLAQAVDRAHHRSVRPPHRIGREGHAGGLRVHHRLDDDAHPRRRPRPRAVRHRVGAERRGPHPPQRVPERSAVLRGAHPQHRLELPRERCLRPVLAHGRGAHREQPAGQAGRVERVQQLGPEAGGELHRRDPGAHRLRRGVRVDAGEGQPLERRRADRDPGRHEGPRLGEPGQVVRLAPDRPGGGRVVRKEDG